MLLNSQSQVLFVRRLIVSLFHSIRQLFLICEGSMNIQADDFRFADVQQYRILTSEFCCRIPTCRGFIFR